MTEVQATLLLMQHQATFVRSSSGVEWWRLPNGEWLGKRKLQGGFVEIRKFPATACGC